MTQTTVPSTGVEADGSPSSDEKIWVASQAQLMWWRFRKHKLAMVSGVVIILLYAVTLFCEFVAPYDPVRIFTRYRLAPPTRIHVRDEDGHWRLPFIYASAQVRDPVTLRMLYIPDHTVIHPVRLWSQGDPYSMFGVIESRLHLFGLDVDRDQEGIFLLGTDRLGRDVFSRVVYGTRLSLSIGLVGIAFSFVLGITLGGISGYFGGQIDNVIQRSIEFIQAIPSLPLWMSLSAALPAGWGIVETYFAITIILSLVGWTGLARVVRGRFLSLREEDFVMAARLAGSSEMRIILRHMVPSFYSHIIASLSLSVPGMILGETGLSFIGLGLRAPAISWGVLLQDAQQISVLASAPWLLMPGLLVILCVIAFNFLGDGLRDAADPYAR